jgi:transglutaminase-like putative cysteine protease
MSVSSDVAVLVPAGGANARASRQDARPAERPGLRLAAFAALALYGTIRWCTLMIPAPGWRMVGLLAVAVATAGIGHGLRDRSRVALIALAVVAVVLMFPLSGLPLRWITHVRIAVTANAIGGGLSALPDALVPYNGVNQWLRMVIVLGGGILLIDAALMLAFAPRPISDLRRAAVALPLVALAIVPCTLVRPQLPYAQGLILFGLLAVFLWGERVRRGEALMAGIVAAVAVLAGMLIAPRLDPHSSWLNYEALAGNLAPAHVDRFDWSQRYGPLRWPRANTEVLDVKAATPDYWKAEDLDTFDGRGWLAASVQSSDAQSTISHTNLARWSQKIQVTVRAMKTFNVIAAGIAAAPQRLPGNIIAGPSEGTWTTSTQLGPGDSYTVNVYVPHPSPAQLEGAGTDYPEQLIPAYLTLGIPVHAGAQGPSAIEPVLFEPFGAPPGGAYGPTIAPPGRTMSISPYAPAYALAQRLARRADTLYDFVLSVEHYLLSSRFRYDENPPRSAYPLETFLFKSRVGYCQQFAGAMAMLLRMGGVPARVAAGFTTGSYNRAEHQYVVTDLNAHAWVEAWFPGFGWVRFDPTPAVAPARGGRSALPIIASKINSPGARSGPSPKGVEKTGTVARTTAPGESGGGPALLIVMLGVALVAIALLARATVLLRPPGQDELLAELERALKRCGRPIAGGTTLATLEQRFHGAPDAEAYVRTLRLARFGSAGGRPTRAQRRALRAELRAGLGVAGMLRALWALPPKLTLRRTVSEPSSTGIHS